MNYLHDFIAKRLFEILIILLKHKNLSVYELSGRSKKLINTQKLQNFGERYISMLIVAIATVFVADVNALNLTSPQKYAVCLDMWRDISIES